MTNPSEPKYAQMPNNKPNITVYRYVFRPIVLLPPKIFHIGTLNGRLQWEQQ